jgi:hypothetical protein
MNDDAEKDQKSKKGSPGKTPTRFMERSGTRPHPENAPSPRESIYEGGAQTEEGTSDQETSGQPGAFPRSAEDPKKKDKQDGKKPQGSEPEEGSERSPSDDSTTDQD